MMAHFPAHGYSVAGGGGGQNLLVNFQGNLPPAVGIQGSKSNNDTKCSIANNAFL
jgi:hypothetical protein